MVPDSLLPANEADRLRTLHRYEVSTLLRESVFDELVRLTARVFNLPISLISIMQAEAAVYIANTGLPGVESQPRVETICALAVRDNKAVVFADLTRLEALNLAPEALAAVQRQNLQFYAGVPLRMPGEVSLGTLCVVDHQPRTLSKEEMRVLEKISEVITQALVARHYCLTAGLGELHWQTLQAELVAQILALTTLVNNMVACVGAQTPVSPQVLGPVIQHLQDLYERVGEYLESKTC